MGCKRICELPDFLLTLILTFLPTKDSVRTSLLSKRWQFLWLRVPALNLRTNALPRFGDVFPSFMEKFLEFNKESRMQKLKIEFDLFDTYPDRFIEWTSRVVDRGIQHLDVRAFLYHSYKPLMPLNIYNSNRLVSLKLVNVALEKPELGVSLPCLKIIHLEDVLFDGGRSIIIEKLISGSSALEDLTLITYHDNYSKEAPLFLCVRSKTLKRFCFKFLTNFPGHDCSVEIDTPRLEYLNFIDSQSERIVIRNLSSLVKLEIDSDFHVKLPLGQGNSSKRDTIRDFLTGISSVRHMIISHITLKVLIYQFARFERMPKFNNLCSFHVMLSSSFLRLSVFLECCPNLKHFILDVSGSLEPEEDELIYVPQCFLWTLETVEIKELKMEEETWKKLARYFIESSGVLKKFILRFKNTPTPNQASDIFKGLLPISMRSRMCQINIY